MLPLPAAVGPDLPGLALLVFDNFHYFCCDQDIRALTGRRWREVIGQAFLFMWPRVLDKWMADRKDSKWWAEGGSNAFYRYFVLLS